MANMYGKSPYAGMKKISGELPVLVILLEPYKGDYARFNTFHASDTNGNLFEMVMSVSREDGAIASREHAAHIAAPFSVDYPPAVARSPHPHRLTLLFATGRDGRVYQTFYDRLASQDPITHRWSGWQALPGNIHAASAPCMVNTPKGDLALAFVTGDDKQVYQSVLARGQGQSWAPWKSLNFPRVSGAPAVMNAADGNALHVFATGTAGSIFQSSYLRGPGSHWVQQQLPGGHTFTGTPACFAAPDGSLESVFALSTEGRVYQTIRSPDAGTDWGAWSALPGNVALSRGLSVLDAENRNSVSVVGVDGTGQLVRCRYLRNISPNRWTNWEPVPTTGVGGAAGGNWLGASQITTPATAESAKTYRDIFFGAGSSLRNWFWEVSQGKFTISDAGMTDWIRPGPALGMPANIDITSYDFVHNSNIPYGITDEHKSHWIIKAAEVIGGFDYSRFDTAGTGSVTLDDLAILWVYAGGDSGRARGVSPSVVKVPSLSGGVSQSYGLPRCGPDPSIRVAAEELVHALLNAKDLYTGSGGVNPDTEPLALAITGLGGDAPHPSPFDKMKAGWANVRIAESTGPYSLPAVETTNEILILRTKTIADEYFILENRNPAGSMEANFPGAGLAVWHIVERFDNAFDGDWARNTVRLLHCQPATIGTIGQTFLWDGGNPTQSYDLTDTSAPANLNWSTGAASGLRIENISAAGPNVTFDVTVP